MASTGSYRSTRPVGATIVVSDAADGDERSDSGSRIQVVQLKYVAASEIRRILEPMSPRSGIIRADDARQTITLPGSDAEIAGMLDAISIFDVDVMKGMSFAIVPVKTPQPTVIADELKECLRLGACRDVDRSGRVSEADPDLGARKAFPSRPRSPSCWLYSSRHRPRCTKQAPHAWGNFRSRKGDYRK
jgi:hypothetical protein